MGFLFLAAFGVLKDWSTPGARFMGLLGVPAAFGV